MPEHVSERRAINLLCAYWDQLRDGRAFPARDEIDPEDISAIWPHCFILKVRSDDEKGYKCVYAGDEAVRLYKTDLRYYSESENVSVFFPQVIEDLVDALESVVEDQRPLIEETEKPTSSGVYVKIRQCLLPLGKDSAVDHIIGVVGGKVY